MNQALSLESLGFTAEELQQRVIDQIVDKVMPATVYYYDEDSKTQRTSMIADQLNKAVRERIDEAVNAIADKHVLPNVTQYLEALTLHETNRWGEKKGASVTFVEYLTQRADAYMREEVNHSGKTKDEDSYSWRASSTRVAYMINQHLQYSIETAMKQALQVANSSIANGLEEAVKIKLAEVVGGIKTTVKV